MAGRAPASTGAHRDIERQLGAPPLKDTPVNEEQLDELPPGWKSRYQEHREAQATEREGNRRAAATERTFQRRERSSSRPRASRRGPSRTRRSSRPTLSDPTGGRLPIGFDGDGIAGAFFGAVLYALVISVADYGAQGPLLWFKAKFLNQPAAAKGSTP